VTELAGIELPRVAGGQMLAFVLALARVGPLFLLAPVFSSRMLPVRVKLIAAGAIALPLATLATGGRPFTGDAVDVVTLVLKEAGVGLALAFAFSLLAAAIQVGASLLDTVVGFSFAALLDPVNNAQNAILGQVYALFAVMVLILTGGDHVMIAGLAKSYEVVPLDVYPGLETLGRLAANGFVDVLLIGLQLVAPVLICLVVTDVAFGIVSRAAPQDNVFVLGLPAKVLVAMAVIGISLPFVATEVRTDLERLVLDGLRALGGQ
jgi:flagellar biosynthetic protein FliR